MAWNISGRTLVQTFYPFLLVLMLVIVIDPSALDHEHDYEVTIEHDSADSGLILRRG